MKCLDITRKRRFRKSIKKHRPECIISIGNPGSRPPRSFVKSTLPKLRLEFKDVVDDSPLSPKKEHIERLINFGRQHIDKSFVIHCQAGVSRSSACAIVLESLNGQDLKWIYPKFYLKFKRVKPNEKILMLSGLLKSENQIEIYEYWKKLFKKRFKFYYKFI
jgi:predicted protein tyrosine phosphatase